MNEIIKDEILDLQLNFKNQIKALETIYRIRRNIVF